MNKIKILQICHGHAAPFGDVAVLYARLFDPQKYELTTIFLKNAPSAELQDRLQPGRVLFYDLDSAKMKGLKLGLIQKLRQEITIHDYQMIIAHRNKSIYLACMASLGRVTVIVGVVHAYGVFDSWTRRLLLKLNKKRLHLLGVSNAIRDDIARQAEKVGFRQVYAQANCLSVGDQQAAHYSRERARNLLHLPQDVVLIGTAGRLHWEKDQVTLIKAFSRVANQIPHVHLVIMGRGELHQYLDNLCQELGIAKQVTFIGMIPEGARYFKAFDLFVLSSAVEPFGLVLVEAMVAGVPVLSSRTGGGGEILDRDDFLFPIADVGLCEQRILALLAKDDRQREEDINWGLQRVENEFSEQAFYKRFWNQPFLLDWEYR
ncbi:MAG: glycosyltransferase [Desulfobulbaceae bacterium]|jgi:glycosyltransferase involved in cell wall biosynthesis|nr:glycosyltransferase [Desulfobulbaceae bacterium]